MRLRVHYTKGRPMRRYLSVVTVLFACSAAVHAHGLLIPEEKSLPPLAMLNHKVTITIDDQVSITKVEQTFRNHTDRQLEATYIFPVPKGASVNRFAMWVNGTETKGELVEAKKARDIYTSIVRRTQDPGLLEYMGNNLLRLRVFPIPPKGDQKVALRFTSVASKEGKLVEYVYPLKTDGKATSTLEEFSITATIKSEHNVTNVYSPTHSISLKRASDKEVTVTFDKNQGLLDKDFQLFYATGDKDVGLTALTHRPLSSENGYFTLLITPRVEISKAYQVPRDMVLVLDTSGSMRGAKMEQARKALKYCLDNLGAKDRFGLINFATTVNRYEDKLLEANSEQIGKAKKWVEELDATGGTAINDALASALELRPKDEGRTFTVVFFTDGQPTIGETDADKILKNTMAKNTANTRIFTFGVGDDVNATMLDQLAEKTRALSHLRSSGGGHREQGERFVQQDQQSGADEFEAVGDQRHQIQRGVSCGVAGLVPRQSVGGAGSLFGQGSGGGQAVGSGGQGDEGVRLRVDVPGEDGGRA